MASASGVFSGRSQYSLVITSNQISQNITGNYSTVSIVGQIVETSENGSWSNNSCGYSITVNGVQRDGVINGFDFRGGSNVLTFLNVTQNIGHNSNGTKSYNFSAGVGSGTLLGTAQAFGANTLSTIPRASTSTWAVQGEAKYAGETYQLNTNRASTSFTHTITYSFNGATGTIGTGVGGSINWTIPLSLIDKLPNSTSGSGTITTRTYSGSTLIGITTSTTGISVPTSVVPTWSSVSHSEANTNVATKVGKYVQGVSKIKYAINGAAGVYSSTITTRQYTIDGQTLSGASGTTPNPISVSGTVPGVFKIVDSRGRQKTQTSNISVLPYSKPKINSMSVVRSLSNGTPDSDDGTYLRVTLNANVSSLVNSTQRNSISLKVYTKLKTASTWTLSRTLLPGGISYNTSFTVAGPFAVDKAYDVRVEVIDIFYTSAAQTTIAVAAVFMHWGNGLGVGKFHERGALDVNGDIYASRLELTGGGDVSLTSTSHPLQLGTDSGANLAMDSNEIQARSNGSASTLNLNVSGGNTVIGNTSSTTEIRGRMNNAHLPWAMAAGDVSASPSFTTVTLPSGRFNLPPIVTATLNSPAGTHIGVSAQVANATSTSFIIRPSGSSTAPFNWLAIQMNSGSADG